MKKACFVILMIIILAFPGNKVVAKETGDPMVCEINVIDPEPNTHNTMSDSINVPIADSSQASITVIGQDSPQSQTPSIVVFEDGISLPSTWTIIDATGTGHGWVVKLSSNTTGLKMYLDNPQTVYGNEPPINENDSFLLSSDPQIVMRAAPDTGMGTFIFHPTFSLQNAEKCSITISVEIN